MLALRPPAGEGSINDGAWTGGMRCAGGSIQGSRHSQQDAYRILDRGVGVFDGVGGLPGGAQAAQAAAAALEKALLAGHPIRVLDRQVRGGPGATTAAVVRFQDGIEAWTVGDSPVLRARKEGAQWRVESVTPSDGQGAVITQCLGRGRPRPHHALIDLAPGDALVVCSDGVSKVLDPHRIGLHLTRDPASSVDAILAAVEEMGAIDNATVVVVMGDDGPTA